MSIPLVHAVCIDYNYIYTTCPNPFCKEYIHKYESNENTENRIQREKSVCPVVKGNEIDIRIDDTSMRTSLNYYKNRSMTFSKRKYTKQHDKNNNKKTKEKNKLEIKNGTFKVVFQ